MVRVPFPGSPSLRRFFAMLLVVLTLSLSWLFLDVAPAAADSDAHTTGVVTDAASYWPNGAIAKLVPSGDAAQVGVYCGWNWANPDKIYFYPGPTDILNVVTVSEWPLALTVTPFNTSTCSAGATKTIPLPDFPLWGGFYAAPDGNFYVVTGRWNGDEDDSFNVVAVRKYDSSWNLSGTGYLKGGARQGIKGVYEPFHAGSCAMWLTGTKLVVHMARLMYAIDGVHHQGNMTFEVDTSSMAVTPFQDGYEDYSYSSHSFNQLVSGSDTDLVVADHGDAYPRAIQVGVASGYPASGYFRSYDVFEFQGSIGANYTGTTLTGLQVGSGRALVTGNSVPHDQPVGGVTGDGYDLQRNVYVVSTDLATGTPVFRWITSYDPLGTTWAGEPRLVKLSDSRFVLLFGVMTSTSETLNYRLLDASGAVLAQKSWANVSFDASSQPLGAGSRLYWAGFGMTPSGGSMDDYYLYGLDLTDPTAPMLMTPPPPTVTALSLSLGSSSGGTAVTITGTNFNRVTAVTFGGAAATSFRVDSATQVTAIAPPHAAGTVGVQVTTMVDSSPDTPADDFTYIATIRYDDKDSKITYEPTWGRWDNSGYWAASQDTYAFTDKAGRKAIVTFEGTYLAWLSRTSNTQGKAKVTLDGNDAEAQVIDLYTPITSWKKAVYSTGLLDDTTHTVVIECLGEKNSGSWWYSIGIDAFDIAGTLKQSPATTKIDDNDYSYFTYDPGIATGASTSKWSRWDASGYWAAYEDTYAFTDQAGYKTTFTFDGTYASWIAATSNTKGKAKVTLDGDTANAKTVDLYSPTTLWKQSVYDTGILAPGIHTVEIECLHEKNSKSYWYTIDVDRFDVMGAP